MDKYKKETISWVQEDENHEAQFVILNEPALPNWMGSCHPNGSLYEKPLNLRAAQNEHHKFRTELERLGCTVKTVREILAQDCEEEVGARVSLENLASQCLKYQLVGTTVDQLTNTERRLISDEYKRECIDKMDVEQLVEVVLTNPTIQLTKADQDTEFLVTNYTFEPLVNLVFCRDQQITTAKGVVLGRPRSPIREREITVMKFCLEKLGIRLIGEIATPGTLEGGDFFPAGKDLCLIGCGLRTNMYAIDQLLTKKLLGTKRVAVVKDYFDQNQQRMHLDTIFNIIAPKTVILLDITSGLNSPLRRLVDEYVLGPDGEYVLGRHDVEFSQYLVDEGYTIIPLSNAMQERYGCNGLNVGNNTMVTVDKDTAKLLARCDSFSGKIVVIDFTNITNMYGSVHCCSQVLARKPPQTNVETSIDMVSTVCSKIFKGDVEEVRALVSRGLNVNAIDYDSRTPLHVACSVGDLDIVRFLIDSGAHLNPIDGNDCTPLDDAMKRKFENVVAYLRVRQAKTLEELKVATLADTTVAKTGQRIYNGKNSTNKILMVAPNNFNVSGLTAQDNAFMRKALQTASSMIKENVNGKRGLHAQMLCEFEELHRILSVDLGVEVHLLTHEIFEGAPEAMYINDWFSTHLETGKPTMVLYPMKMDSRKNEITEQKIHFLQSLAKFDILNLSGSNNEGVQFNKQFVPRSQPLPEDSTTVNMHSLEQGSVVFDRMQKLVFASEACTRLSKDVVAVMLRELGSNYESHYFRLVDCNNALVERLHHTRAILAVGTQVAFVCREAILPEDYPALAAKLAGPQKRKIIEVTLEQASSLLIVALAEVLDQSGEPVLVMSQSARALLSPEQLVDIQSVYKRVVSCNLSTIEILGGGSVSGLLAHLH